MTGIIAIETATDACSVALLLEDEVQERFEIVPRQHAALLLPFTLTMDPVHAIAVLATIYCSATFAGSITAILINTPGTSAAAATCLDGYPLAQRGEAGRALGIAVSMREGGNILRLGEEVALLRARLDAADDAGTGPERHDGADR